MTTKRSAWTQILATFLAATLATACGGGSGGGGENARGRARAGLTGAPPTAPTGASGSPAEEDQGDFASPPTNTGAFVHRIPIDIPAGIGAMTPDVALAYSSQGGVGVAGVGWDMPLPLITINQADGVRPPTVEADIMRFPAGTPVERYSSHFGVLAEIREEGDYVTSTKSYLFTAHNDSRVEPIVDDTGFPEHTGEKAAWQVTTKDGTSYRYGYLDDASLWRDDATGDKAKVGWLLDRVEDTHGNRMHYYYEEYPGNQDTFRQPILRAIEYGVPASDQSTSERMVVLFDYIQSPWKRTSYGLGTRTDFAYLLDKVCTFAKTAVVAGTTPGGHRTWTVPNADATQPSDNQTKTGCVELTYQFEEPSAHAAGYTGRPLLVEVEKSTRNGSALPPWTFTYSHQATRWDQVYQTSVDAGGRGWFMPDEASLERSTLDVETQSLDVNGDSLADLVEGKTDGTVGVRLARPRANGIEYQEESWPHPLAAHAAPADLTVSALTTQGESDSSEVWWTFTATVAWEVGAGLGYAVPLVSAPFAIFELWNHSGPDGDWNEGEPGALPFGGLRFLHRSFIGPAPSVGMRNWTDRAQTIDQHETFGSFRDRRSREVQYDTSNSDGEDAGDNVELDQCWGVGPGPTAGRLGADLQCYDEPGSRFFAAGGVPIEDAMERGYASELWNEQDMNGDGLVDLVFASPVIVRDEDGIVRNARDGDNDWWVALGTGSGWSAPQRWTVPSKTPDLPEVGMVHGTPLLGVTVADSELRSNRTWGGGAMISYGVTGWGVAPTIVTPGGAVGLPGISGGWDGSVNWGGVATGAAMNAGFTVAYFAGANQRVLSAAARSVQAVEASFNPMSLFPSVGVGMNVTNKGAYYVLDLWFLGQVEIHLALEPKLSRTQGYQGMGDMTGDGKPDLVSAKFQTPIGTLNPTSHWLVYRNTGDGFEEPFVMRFVDPPRTAAGADVGVSMNIDSMSRSTTSNYADTLAWHPIEWDKFPLGSVEQDWGLMDINGDGRADLVDSTPQGCRHQTTGVLEQCWTVYFNAGEEFSAPIEWPFSGNWQTQHGPNCSAVFAYPRLSRSVFGQTAEEQRFEERIVMGRQVQLTGDVNGDGLPDFVYEMPAPVNDTDGFCDYINPSSNFEDADEISRRVSPYRLHRKVLVRLNTGDGFGPPIDWVGTNGFALSGVVAIGEGERPTDATSYAALGIGDFDADGAPDLGVRSDSEWYGLGDTAEISRLYRLGETDVDMLATATTPDGGRIEIDYRYQRPDVHLASGQWVTASVRTLDLDQSRLDVTRRYYYEGGRYDRERRVFQGFERVYQATDGADGYTLSRYYQTPGFEGQLYCKAVRRLEDAAEVVESLSEERAEAWMDTPLGDHRPGWVPPIAIGDAEHADQLAGGPALSDDRDDLAEGPEPPEGTSDSYGQPPANPPVEDPAIEEEEQDRQDTDEETVPEVVTPDWQAPETVDVSHHAWNDPPVDVDAPGSHIPWNPEDAATAPPWWDTPVHDDDCTPGIGEQALFVCDPATIPLPALACGDEDDPGVLVHEEFSIPGDFSTIPEVHNVRPRVGSSRVYDPTGGHPLVTASDLTYDQVGNVTRARDLGDLATPDDDLIIETGYQPPNETAHVIDRRCDIHVTDGAGDTISRTRFEWDGTLLFTCSTPVAVGDLTSIQRFVDSSTWFSERFEYSDEGLVTVHTDGRGNQTTTEYNGTFPWFPVRQSRDVVNASGPVTLTSETRWLGVNELSLTHFGLIGKEIDPTGATTERTYDAFDRPLKVIRPGDSGGAPTEAWAYHEWNGDQADRGTVAHTRRFDAALSVTTTTVRDGFGLVARVEQPPPDNIDGCVAGCVAVTREETYDAEGRVVTKALPYFSNSAAEPQRIATTYDLLGRITSVTGPSGARTMTGYDRDLRSEVDPDGYTTVTRSDVRGNSTGVYRYSGGGATLYSGIESTYRPDGVLTGMVDSAGNQWSFDHDWLGRQTSMSDPNTGERSTVHDENGNPVIVTDERYDTLGLAMGMAYDALDRVLLREVRAGTTVNGDVLQGGVTNERSVFWYDVDPATFPGSALACGGNNNRGRLSRVVQWLNLGSVLTEVSRKEYCYDQRGRVRRVAHTIGGQTYQFEYAYGSADQLLTMEYPDGDVVVNQYDASGRLASSSNAGGPLVASSRAGADGLTVRRTFGAGGLKQRFCYQPGASGNELSRVLVGGAGMSMDCPSDPDPVPGAVWDVAYQRTAAGRIETREETFERPGSGPEDHTTGYVYDDAMRLESETADGVLTSFEYDQLDNLVGMGGELQDYGESARPVRMAGPNAILAGAGGRTFAYDKAGHVLSMTSGGVQYGFLRAFAGQPLAVTANGIPDTAVYYYDEGGQRVLRARSGAGTIYAGPFHDDGVTPRTHYPGVGIKVGQTQYFTIGDAVDSNALLFDAAGRVVQYTRYEPHGGLREDAVFDPDPADGLTPHQTDFLYNGKERDETFGADDDVFDFGPRMYFADVGAWLQPDATFADGPNRYAFVKGDPINGSDPTGEQKYAGWGHHIIVQEVYRGASSQYAGKFSQKAMDVFDQWTSGPLVGHGYSIAHAAYNQAVLDEVATFGQTIGKTDVSTWDADDAFKFVEHVMASEDPKISTFLDEVADQIDNGKLTPNQARNLKTYLNLGDRFKARWPLSVRKVRGVGPLGLALGGFVYLSYYNEAHACHSIALQNYAVDTAFDVGTLGLMANGGIAPDDLSFKDDLELELSTFVERWEGYEDAEFPECPAE